MYMRLYNYCIKGLGIVFLILTHRHLPRRCWNQRYLVHHLGSMWSREARHLRRWHWEPRAPELLRGEGPVNQGTSPAAPPPDIYLAPPACTC